jgi:hypothetical protein
MEVASSSSSLVALAELIPSALCLSELSLVRLLLLLAFFLPSCSVRPCAASLDLSLHRGWKQQKWRVWVKPENKAQKMCKSDLQPKGNPVSNCVKQISLELLNV